MPATPNTSEYLTRKQIVDSRLKAAGRNVCRLDPDRPPAAFDRCAIEEFPTESGPADYALCVGGQILGVVEAKKLTLGPQEVLPQAERYSRGLKSNPFNFDGFHVPFLYSTNGEIIWYHDVRDSMNRSRQMPAFHTLVVPEGTEPFALQRSVAVIKPLFVDSPFLGYNFRAPGSQAFFEEHGAGTAQRGVYLGTLSDMPLPLAPLAEQHRIVAKIEELLEHVKASHYHLAKAQLILKRFRQAVLSAACSGRLTEDWRKKHPIPDMIAESVETIRVRRETEARSVVHREKLRQIYDRTEDNDSTELPEGWHFVALNKLCASFDYGTSAKSQPSGKVPVLRMGNIQRGEIDWTDLVYTSDPEEIRQYLLEPYTVLFNRTNSPELVGKTAIYRGDRPAIFAGYLIRIVPFPALDPQYLNLCLNTNYAREFCSQVKTDGVSQSNINAQKLGSFQLPFCPLPEQQEIVRSVEALFKLADIIEERVAAATKRADKLTQAILAKAFRGELVSTEAELARREGRAYEPASALLERIRAERDGKEATTSKTQGRRRLSGEQSTRV